MVEQEPQAEQEKAIILDPEQEAAIVEMLKDLSGRLSAYIEDLKQIQPELAPDQSKTIQGFIDFVVATIGKLNAVQPDHLLDSIQEHFPEFNIKNYLFGRNEKGEPIVTLPYFLSQFEGHVINNTRVPIVGFLSLAQHQGKSVPPSLEQAAEKLKVGERNE